MQKYNQKQLSSIRYQDIITDKGSSTYYVAAEGGGGGMGFAIIATKGEGGFGVCNVATLIRLDFDFDKPSNIVVITLG